jgi:peptidoglycan/LPS O-acetylase OafA/YrhL
MRIAAAAAVVTYHYLYLFLNNGDMVAHLSASPTVQLIAAHGYLGVELFFMISGYVIALSAEGRTRTEFAAARFARLWPTFVLCLAITVTLLTVVGKTPSLSTVVANLTMLPRLLRQPYVDGAYWSLMIEIVFYVAIAAIVISNDFVRRLRLFIAAWLAVAIAGTAIGRMPMVTVALEYAPFFSIGVAVFLLRRAGGSRFDWALLVVATVTALFFAAEQVARSPAFEVAPRPLAVILIVAASAALVYVAPAISLGPRAAHAAFVLGGISYPLYLLHSVVGTALANALPPLWGIAAIAAAAIAIFALSYVIWKIEVPLRKRVYLALTPNVTAIVATGLAYKCDSTRTATQGARAARPN